LPRKKAAQAAHRRRRGKQTWIVRHLWLLWRLVCDDVCQRPVRAHLAAGTCRTVERVQRILTALAVWALTGPARHWPNSQQGHAYYPRQGENRKTTFDSAVIVPSSTTSTTITTTITFTMTTANTMGLVVAGSTAETSNSPAP